MKQDVVHEAYRTGDNRLRYEHPLDKDTCDIGALDVQPLPNLSDYCPYPMAIFTYLFLAPSSVSLVSETTYLGLGDQAAWTRALGEKFN